MVTACRLIKWAIPVLTSCQQTLPVKFQMGRETNLVMLLAPPMKMTFVQATPVQSSMLATGGDGDQLLDGNGKPSACSYSNSIMDDHGGWCRFHDVCALGQPGRRRKSIKFPEAPVISDGKQATILISDDWSCEFLYFGTVSYWTISFMER